MIRYLSFLILSFLFIQCSVKTGGIAVASADFEPDTLTYSDQSRGRKIPIAIYQPKNKKTSKLTPIIFSHGWGENKGGDYFVYSYLTKLLASKGYFVVSIQHELPTDEMLAIDGNFQVTRMPNWERGARNIFFVLNQLKKDFPDLDYHKLAVIGHSNGGDMTALFAHQHPELIHKVITMDNRRMPLPRTAHPKIYTLRSNDYPADEGVLPTEEEKKKYGMTVDFTPINHGHMDNDATPEEGEYMTLRILKYLKN
ncbi:alpha/beta hydrolase [Chryseobacterium indologenes]|uniref:alpha/beta hydrolase n=1 Tax=Chryseobacterium indologenes TaxID=253 RepID=UPI000ADA2FD3|nr:alpha/beta hydrolase [Chryseobacterium indologenes]